MAAHKTVAQYVCHFFHRAGKFNLTVFRMENDFMDIAGSFKKENFIVIYADLPPASMV